MKDGPYVFFHESGQKAEEGAYEADQLVGHWQQWDEKGHLTLDIAYQNGSREGPYSAYVDGAATERGNYAKDQLEGAFEYLGLDGLIVSGMMSAGSPTGVWTISTPAGKMLGRSRFTQGTQDGATEAWDSDGTLHSNDTKTACAEFDGYRIGTLHWQQVVFDLMAHAHAFPRDGGVNKFSGGRMLVLRDNLIQLPGVKKLTLIFGPDDLLTAIAADATKEGDGGYAGAFKQLHAQYSRKYRVVSASLPFVGDYHAEYESAGCRILLDAPHLGFDMTIQMYSREFSRLLSAAR